MERLGHRTPRTPPRAGGDWGGAHVPDSETDACGRRRQVCWPSSRTGGAAQARAPLLTRQDRRRARPSSSASARRWDGLDSCERRGSVATGDGFIIDSLPAPAFVRRRARAWRCRKAPGRECCGECAAKREKFFGWRVQLVCRPDGVPVHVPMLPTPPNPPACGGDWGGASGLPAGAQLLGVAANNYSPQQRG
jgi:hypothetical protein